MSTAWDQWLTGLVNAAISGVASGGTASLIGVGWKQALSIAGASALVSVLKWVMQHPLPEAPAPVTPVVPISSPISNTNQGNAGKI
jgi:hypothetical protein